MLLTGLAIANVADAQVADLSPEQRRLLQQLPPAQRQALLDQIGSTAPADSTRELPDKSADTLRTPAVAIDDLEDEAAEEARFAPGDALVVFATVTETDDVDSAEETKKLIESGNPYTLDQLGTLALPGTVGVPLAGLTEALAATRLSADSALTGLDIRIVLLPLERFGFAALQPYGYDFFERDQPPPDTSQIPVPTTYTIGPGDGLRLQLFGAQTAIYELSVDRDGVLNVPELGPVTVAGMSFDAMRADIQRRVSAQLTGTDVSVTLSDLRTIQVFVSGDVIKPGSYNVSALSTMLDVLQYGGGIARSGSLRDVRLNRNGQTIARLDLYQLLLFGNASRNRRVHDGDVIFVAPVGPQVSVSGAVQRPAIYESRGSLSVRGALQLAGGVKSSALLSGARLQRSDPAQGVTVVGLNLSDSADLETMLEAGDALLLPGDTDQIDKAVRLSGHVFRPGLYDWHEGMRLSQLIRFQHDLKPEADLGYVLVERQQSPNGPITAVSADLGAWWRSGEIADDLQLEARDRVYVFSRTQEQARSVYLAEVLDRLRRQATSDSPSAIVRVGGLVNAPGDYPLEPGMTISDLIRAGGGLAESAYRGSAELTRFSSDSLAIGRNTLLKVDLAAILRGEDVADVTLNPYDFLNIKQLSRWAEQQFIEIRGEVLFPGVYPLFEGEKLSSAIERAGGLTPYAFPEGSVFTRESLKSREREQLDSLAARIESDLASLALSDTAQTEALTIGRSLLTQIETTEPAGRLVIDLSGSLTANSEVDILLRDGDVLSIPPRSQEVTVIGEVQYATSHLWAAGVSRDDYIQRSGGVTVKADERRIYVVRANGEVVVSNRSRFFSRSQGLDIRPGDTIVVPLDTDRVKPLVLWSSATQILYNLAIAAAAVNSF